MAVACLLMFFCDYYFLLNLHTLRIIQNINATILVVVVVIAVIIQGMESVVMSSRAHTCCCCKHTTIMRLLLRQLLFLHPHKFLLFLFGIRACWFLFIIVISLFLKAQLSLHCDSFYLACKHAFFRFLDDGLFGIVPMHLRTHHLLLSPSSIVSIFLILNETTLFILLLL